MEGKGEAGDGHCQIVERDGKEKFQRKKYCNFCYIFFQFTSIKRLDNILTNDQCLWVSSLDSLKERGLQKVLSNHLLKTRSLRRAPQQWSTQHKARFQMPLRGESGKMHIMHLFSENIIFHSVRISLSSSLLWGCYLLCYLLSCLSAFVLINMFLNVDILMFSIYKDEGFFYLC